MCEAPPEEAELSECRDELFICLPPVDGHPGTPLERIEHPFTESLELTSVTGVNIKVFVSVHVDYVSAT